MLCFASLALEAQALSNEASVNSHPVQAKAISLCYTPWWVDWRLPSPVHADLPLQMVNPKGWREGYASFNDFEAAAYENTVKNLERAGIDIICWDTFGKEQVRLAGGFLKACERLDTPVRLVPYLDVHEAVKPDLQNTVTRFETLIRQYEEIPQYARFHWAPYIWTWGTHNLPPEIWSKVFAGLRERGVDESQWVGHLPTKPTGELNREINGAYFPLFAGAYSWQPMPLRLIEPTTQLFKQSFAGKNAEFVGSVYPMFRRYGYGLNFVAPEGFQVFKKSWETVLVNQASQVHLVTWNDYEEDTMLMPTVSRGFCLIDLNAYFSKLFHTGDEGVEQSRVYLSYPRSGLKDTESYLDITGVYSPQDLPCKIGVTLKNEEGKEIETLRQQVVTKAGIQSTIFRFRLNQKRGASYKPEVTLSLAKGGSTVLQGAPAIDVYDPGAVRDRNVWMLHSDEVAAETGIALELSNDPVDLTGGMLKKPAQFTVNGIDLKNFNYLVLKRNGEQAAVIRGDGAYLPTGAVGGDWGWHRYANVTITEAPGGGVSIRFPESPILYALPKDGGGVLRQTPDLTQYSRDWYTAIVVDYAWQRRFSNSLIVKRSAQNPVIAEYKSMTPGNGTVLDDTLKGFDLKDFSGKTPKVVRDGGTPSLRVTPEFRFMIPNESLAGKAEEINLDFTARETPVQSVALFWSRTGELQLYIDKDSRIVARALIDPEKKEYASVVSQNAIKPEEPIRCKVQVSRPGALALYINGKMAGKADIPAKLDSNSGSIYFIRPLGPDLIQDDCAVPPRYIIDVKWLRIMAI